MKHITPHYTGKFEAFRDLEGEQYARLEFNSGSYVWFKFDYFTESYQSFANELFEVVGKDKRQLQNQLEKSYQTKKDA